MKKITQILKQGTAFVLAGAMVFGGSLTFAGKSETVYFMLGNDGALEKTVVVNAFSEHGDEIVDYGDYINVENLSSLSGFSGDGEKLSFKPDSDDVFYYRGELEDAESPWVIELSYTLDGKEVKPEELAGATGLLKMKVLVKPASMNDFVNNYAIQMQGAFINGVSEIMADGASVMAIGSQYQVGSIVLPKKEKEFLITAQVDGLELGAFTFTAVATEFDGEFDAEGIKDGVEKLSDGSMEVLNGIAGLQEGIQQTDGGLSSIAGASSQLMQAANGLKQGAEGIHGGLTEFAPSLTQFSEGTKGLLGAVQQSNQGLAQVKAIAEGAVMSPDPSVQALAKALLGQIELGAQLETNLMQLSAGEEQAVAGLQGLLQAQGDFVSGMNEYTAGVGQEVYGLNQLSGGVKQLSAGADALYGGQKEFVVGMDEAKIQLEQVIGSLDTEVQSAPKSFVSEKNKVDSVQFIMRTPEIRIPKVEKEPLAPIPKKGFFEKLKGLFD